ncbi:hypothetical protein B0J12DRAFT_143986 [Macrophomina phaseolina]|uniref:Uncharacterized protein n=1 Tax=Macrophomina phaseolina TaxID=35725 RepID=A0ABQ8G6B4_9PEZI|nr:hypothetical protein B0J12DRAFT_143986 [Macrophomina phaseolina]
MMLSIVDTSQFQSVISSDIGRRNRFDLPSWVPDWSALYDNLDRHRSLHNRIYTLMRGSKVRILMDEEDVWTGILKLIGNCVLVNAEHISKSSKSLQSTVTQTSSRT